MKISHLLKDEKITLSFEVFPPKTETKYKEIQEAAFGVAALNPSYMSVTYGAGGSTRSNTLKIAKSIQS